MLFSQTTEYALRATVTLATFPDRSITTAEIAERTKVPPDYLSKVLQLLNRAGIVKVQRGLKGGYTLNGSPEEISVLSVVNAVDPIQRIEKCPLGLAEHATLCPLHRQIDEAIAAVEAKLALKTLAEMVDPLQRDFTNVGQLMDGQGSQQ